MKVIYDKKTGYIYTTAYIGGEITPAVIEVDNPQNLLVSKVVIEEGKEPRVEFYENPEQTKLKELEDKISDLTHKQQSTDLALTELAMNSVQS